MNGLVTGLDGGQLDDEVGRNGGKLPAFDDHLLPIVEVRVDLDRDRLVGAFEDRGDLLDDGHERLTRNLHMARVSGDTVDIPHLEGVFDLVGHCAIEEELHLSLLLVAQGLQYIGDSYVAHS